MGSREGATCSSSRKQNTDDLHMRMFSCERSLEPERRAQQRTADMASAVVTWIEVRPWPGGMSHCPISSSVARGGGRLQGLHGEAVCEQVRMELCTGPQLREGENRRHMRKESCPSEYFSGKASHPKIQCNSIHKYLLSNDGGSGTGLNRESIRRGLLQWQVIPENAARGGLDFSL